MPFLRAQFLLLALLLLTALPTLADERDNGNPNGDNGGGKTEWKKEWTTAFMKCWEKNAEEAGSGKPGAIEQAINDKKLGDLGPGNSEKNWCPADGALDEPYKIKLMMLSTFKALAGRESSYKPEAVNEQGATEPAIGLFQIGVKDSSEKHHCKDANGGSISSRSDLQDPEKNICCALKIATDVAKGQGVNGGGDSSGDKVKDTPDNKSFATNNHGIMAAFWQPMHDSMVGETDNSVNRKKIKGFVDESCKAIASGSSTESPKCNLTPDDFDQALAAHQEAQAIGSGRGGTQ